MFRRKESNKVRKTLITKKAIQAKEIYCNSSLKVPWAIYFFPTGRFLSTDHGFIYQSTIGIFIISLQNTRMGI